MRPGMLLVCVLLFVACLGAASAQEQWTVPSRLDTTRLCRAIDSYLGTPYRFGGTTRQGMDCSGFVTTVYRAAGANLPHSSTILVTMGQEVPREQLRAGDLVFFNTFGKSTSHVGVMRRPGVFAHASSSNGVRLDELTNPYWAGVFVTGRRLVASPGRRQASTGAEVDDCPNEEELRAALESIEQALSGGDTGRQTDTDPESGGGDETDDETWADAEEDPPKPADK